VRVLRSRPPRGGDLARYRTRAAFDTPASPDQAMATARRVLRGNRYRLADHPEGFGEPQGGAPVGRGGELAAEKGYLREAASMLFHVSLLVLLVGLAYGKGYGYRGQAAIVEGETWANARVGYDAFSPGRFFGPERLAPFQLRLDDFTNSFHPDNTPREFASRLTALDLDGRRLQAQRVAPNRPMTVDGVRIFQSDYGYVPVVRVRGADGKDLLASQEVLTLRDPAAEVSNGAVKVTRAAPQVGLELTLFTGLRTAPDCPGGARFCNDPRLVRPVLVVLAYQGDLQADRAQSVFSLDRTRLEPLGDRPLLLGPGQSGRLANGMEVSFTDLKQYSVFTLARDPGVPLVAVAAALLLCGLVPSLYVTRRRVWVRAVPAGTGGARVELAGLALQGKAAFEGELARLADQLRRGTLDPPERST
jgi:cytochrome c biogenesis protein